MRSWCSLDGTHDGYREGFLYFDMFHPPVTAHVGSFAREDSAGGGICAGADRIRAHHPVSFCVDTTRAEDTVGSGVHACHAEDPSSFYAEMVHAQDVDRSDVATMHAGRALRQMQRTQPVQALQPSLSGNE